MSQYEVLCQRLQTLWHEDFPLSKAMDMQVQSYVDHQLTTRTALSPNTNVHGTAFAGSLYAIQALTAWGLLYLELEIAGLDASIIHARGQIDFAKPVREDIIARSSFSEHADTMQTLKDTGKVRLELSTEVIAEQNVASRFSGTYVVRIND